MDKWIETLLRLGYLMMSEGCVYDVTVELHPEDYARLTTDFQALRTRPGKSGVEVFTRGITFKICESSKPRVKAT